MGNSLFDQLQKSGLVDDKKAKKAKQNQYKSKKQKMKKGEVDEVTLQAQKTQAEKAARDRQLNQLKKDEADRKAITSQIRQLIESNRIEDCAGDVIYNFSDGNVIKRIYISEKAHNYLISGRLAIAKLGEAYELVPTPVANKIKQRDEQCIIVCENSTEVELPENDPYADYKIPDDLMW